VTQSLGIGEHIALHDIPAGRREANTENGCPVLSEATNPAAPLTNAGRAEGMKCEKTRTQVSASCARSAMVKPRSPVLLAQ